MEKSIKTLHLLAVAALALLILPCTATEKNGIAPSDKLLIGWSEVDITPSTDKWVRLGGQYYTRYTKEIFSRLKFIAAAIQFGDEYVLMGTMDATGTNAVFHEKVRDLVTARLPELDRKKIFYNVTHTHCVQGHRITAAAESNGSNASATVKTNSKDVWTSPEYAEFLAPLVARAFVEAWNNRQPGGIARAFGNARIGHSRRALFSNGKAEMYGDTTRDDFIGMESGEDTGIEMLFTFDADGRKTGMFLNVACPSQVMESCYKISSDFAGEARELLKKEYGDNFHTLYLIAPAGCQSPRDLTRHNPSEPDGWHEDAVHLYARRLFSAVTNADIGKIDTAPVFKQKQFSVQLPRRRVTDTQYEAARKELARLLAIQGEESAYKDFCDKVHANEKKGGPGPYDNKLDHYVLIQNNQAVIKRYNDQDKIPNASFEMNVIRLGDMAIATNPFELYLYYGQIIRARSKAPQTMLIELCQAATPLEESYLPSPIAEQFGGYGGEIVSSQVGHEGGYKLCDITVSAINSLFDDNK